MPKWDRRVAELIRIYSYAEARIIRLLDAALAANKLSQARYRRRVLEQVRAILAELREQTPPAAKSATVAAYETGMIAGMRPNDRLRGSFGGPHRLSIDVLSQALITRLDGATATVGRQVQDVFRTEQLKATAHMLAQGNTLSEGVSALEAALRRRGNTAFVDKAGRQWQLSTYAEMAIRTVTAEAHSTGLQNKMLEQGYDLVKISHHVHKADVCDPFDGKVFSITGSTEGYPVLSKWPPFHPRCRHLAIAAKENFLG